MSVGVRLCTCVHVLQVNRVVSADIPHHRHHHLHPPVQEKSMLPVDLVVDIMDLVSLWVLSKFHGIFFQDTRICHVSMLETHHSFLLVSSNSAYIS